MLPAAVGRASELTFVLFFLNNRGVIYVFTMRIAIIYDKSTWSNKKYKHHRSDS